MMTSRMTNPHVDDLLAEAITGSDTICGATSRRRLLPAADFTARGEMSAEALAIWFRQRSRPLEP